MKDLTNYLRRKTASEEELQAADMLEQMAAALEAKDEALGLALDSISRFTCDEGSTQRDFDITDTVIATLAIQPHADLVRKMKADAVREAADEVEVGHPHITRVGASCILRERAARIERGEVR